MSQNDGIRKDVEITVRIDEANLDALTYERPIPAGVGVALVKLSDGAYRLALRDERRINRLSWADIEEPA